jgi:hypothetical protein
MAQLQASTVAGILTTTGNVGIGTTNPGAKLVVVGNGEFTDTLVVSKGASDTIQAGSSLYLIGGSGASYTQLQQGVGRFIIFGFNGSSWIERFTINNTSGDVGIGTASPSTKLEVGNFLDAFTNKITVSARYEYEPEFNFKLGQSGTNFNWIGAVISSGDDGNYNGKILFKTANAGRDTPTTKMVIKASGNVGIGTVSPEQKLDVRGTIYSVNSGTDGGQIRVQNSGGGNAWYWAARTTGLNLGQLGVADARIFVTNGGSVGIGTDNPVNGSKLEVRGSGVWDGGVITLNNTGAGGGIWSIFSTNNLFSQGGGKLLIYNATADTNAMVINSSNNIGVGTTNPEAVLHVAKTGTDDQLVLGSAATNRDIAMFMYSGTTKAEVLRFQSAFRLLIGLGSGITQQSFFTGGTEKLTILSGGNVGIGTVSPGYKLDVNGNIRAGLANSTALLVQASGTATTQAAIAIQQLTGEGDTIIFADYEPFAEYGIIARNSIDSIDFTGGTTAGNLDSYNITNRSGASRTAYILRFQYGFLLPLSS